MQNYRPPVTGSERPAGLVTAVWAATFVTLVFITARACDGRVIYTLDDPYIHLSVAENILRGNYGVNSGEFSTPSSSIIYPFLLAPLLQLGCGELSPLVLNFMATGASVWLLTGYFFRQIHADERRPFYYVVAFLLLFGINAYALPLTGMEHSLHVLTVIVAFCGLTELKSKNRAPSSLIAAIVMMPFIRFEGVAFSIASTAVIFASRRPKTAGFILAAQSLGFFIWFLFTRHMGLPFFPSSVSLKSAFAANAQDGDTWSGIGIFMDNFLASAHDRQGLALILFVGALLVTSRQRDPLSQFIGSREYLIKWAVVFALLAHVFAGAYGQFFRYEVYAFAIMLLGAIQTQSKTLEKLCAFQNPSGTTGLALILFALVLPFLGAAAKTPAAARGIYEQQFQMHRFATEFLPRPVAVNDLGLVSFQNDNYVLDLFGLGSDVVRRAKVSGTFDKSFVSSLASQKKIDFAMIYNKWFKNSVPDSWCHIATLQTDVVTAGGPKVAFYALNDRIIKEMRAALTRLQSTLPEGASLALEDSDCARS